MIEILKIVADRIQGKPASVEELNAWQPDPQSFSLLLDKLEVPEHTNMQLAQELVSHIQIQGKVYDPFCRSGSLLIAAKANASALYAQAPKLELAMLHFKAYNMQVEAAESNAIFEDAFENLEPDCIVCHLPSLHQASWLSYIIKKLGKKSRAALFLQSFQGPSMADLRKQMISENLVEKVVRKRLGFFLILNKAKASDKCTFVLDETAEQVEAVPQGDCLNPLSYVKPPKSEIQRALEILRELQEEAKSKAEGIKEALSQASPEHD